MFEDAATPPALSARDIVHRYGGVLALDGISVDIGRGRFVSVLGPNGAGKSTLGLILAGLITPSRGSVLSGGREVGGHAGPVPGVRLVPEGRRLFGQLSVAENLLLGGFGAGASTREIKRRMERVLEGLPERLRGNPGRIATTLSGGEQQMLAIGRALMAEPDTLIIDEPSMGLAPILINQVYEVLARLHAGGVTIVLLEQMATHAVRHSDLLVILDRGRLVYAGSPQSEAANAALLEGYVGEEAL
ncbi:MAG TPA: ATP-binding cassette domain-containing protein [Paracoccaceae bacterium]|nr:ATP-binding cassette domain-containing protein [Paracoccaceae bacterium]